VVFFVVMKNIPPQNTKILLCVDFRREILHSLLDHYDLQLHHVEDGKDIPGSYWGAPEAGIRGTNVFVRDDTPIHSLLHETCHILCMSPPRRAVLNTEAGGDDAEENAVCYLQILLADHLEGVGRTRLMADMDRWGYSFRLGSTKAWFEEDAEDARQWLIRLSLIDPTGGVQWKWRV
jgi:hypothetical protein